MTLSSSKFNGTLQIPLGITTNALLICLNRNEDLTIPVECQRKVEVKSFLPPEKRWRKRAGTAVERSFWNKREHCHNFVKLVIQLLIQAVSIGLIILSLRGKGILS